MADIDDLLRRQKEKLEGKSIQKRKRITRTGPTRPWQENLAQYQQAKTQKQTQAKLEPKLSQTRAKLEPQLRPNLESILSQTEAKLEPTIDLFALVGLQRKILLEIYNACRINGSKLSDPIAIEILAESAETTVSAARKAIQRLEQKKFLIRKVYKEGRGGWTRYELPDATYHIVMLHQTRAKLEPKLSQTRAKLEPELRPQPEPTPSSSSSIDLDLNKTTTTTGNTESLVDLPPEWNVIETDVLNPIGFGRHQLIQLARVGIVTPDQIQESIYAFAFDLEVNGKSKEINGSALNYFMGILRRGPYAPPTNYEPPDVRQRRLYLEGKEREQRAREELDARLEAIEFDSWAAGLSAKEKLQIVSPSDFAKLGSQSHNAQLKEYFRKNVWLERQKSILSNL